MKEDTMNIKSLIYTFTLVSMVSSNVFAKELPTSMYSTKKDYTASYENLSTINTQITYKAPPKKPWSYKTPLSNTEYKESKRTPAMPLLEQNCVFKNTANQMINQWNSLYGHFQYTPYIQIINRNTALYSYLDFWGFLYRTPDQVFLDLYETTELDTATDITDPSDFFIGGGLKPDLNKQTFSPLLRELNKAASTSAPLSKSFYRHIPHWDIFIKQNTAIANQQYDLQAPPPSVTDIDGVLETKLSTTSPQATASTTVVPAYFSCTNNTAAITELKNSTALLQQRQKSIHKNLIAIENGMAKITTALQTLIDNFRKYDKNFSLLSVNLRELGVENSNQLCIKNCSNGSQYKLSQLSATLPQVALQPYNILENAYSEIQLEFNKNPQLYFLDHPQGLFFAIKWIVVNFDQFQAHQDKWLLMLSDMDTEVQRNATAFKEQSVKLRANLLANTNSVSKSLTVLYNKVAAEKLPPPPPTPVKRNPLGPNDCGRNYGLNKMPTDANGCTTILY